MSTNLSFILIVLSLKMYGADCTGETQFSCTARQSWHHMDSQKLPTTAYIKASLANDFFNLKLKDKRIISLETKGASDYYFDSIDQVVYFVGNIISNIDTSDLARQAPFTYNSYLLKYDLKNDHKTVRFWKNIEHSSPIITLKNNKVYVWDKSYSAKIRAEGDHTFRAIVWNLDLDFISEEKWVPKNSNFDYFLKIYRPIGEEKSVKASHVLLSYRSFQQIVNEKILLEK